MLRASEISMQDLQIQAVRLYGGRIFAHIVLICDGRQSFMAAPDFGDICE